MKLMGITLGLTLVLALPAAATVIEVPIPEFAGTFSCSIPPDSGCHRTVMLHLPTLPSAIRSVSLRILGTTSFGVYACDTRPPAPLNTLIDAELYEPGNTRDYWQVWHVNGAEGPIDDTLRFEAGYGMNGTWTFLLDGTAGFSFNINGGSPIPECILVGPPDSTTIESVTVLVDGDFPTLVAHPSWGRLKAIYR